MTLKERIARRHRTPGDLRLVLESDALNPIAHPAEPTGRETVIEQLLDGLAPVFDGHCPGDCYVWGPKGAGKSAVVRPLFEQLRRLLGRNETEIYTTTRTAPAPNVRFVYVDARRSQSAFALLHTVVDTVIAESIPRQGVGSDVIIERFADHLAETNRQLVVAVDHVGEPETLSVEAAFEQFDAFGDAVSCLAVGRTEPTDTVVSSRPGIETIHVDAYTQYSLVEVLTNRVADGRLRTATTDEQLTALARWAEGDAHDALAALFVATDRAAKRNRSTVTDDDIAHATATMPRPDVSLAQVLLLPPSRQQVLRALLDVPESDRSSVENTTAAIAAAGTVDLSAGTLKRYLYELADDGFVERIRTDGSTSGRPPSRIEPRFPTRVFRRLHELDGVL